MILREYILAILVGAASIGVFVGILVYSFFIMDAFRRLLVDDYNNTKGIRGIIEAVIFLLFILIMMYILGTSIINLS